MKLNKKWKFEELFPKVSAYTTAYNCLKNGYPILEAIKSFSWADQVVVVDGGSDDGTVEAIEGLGLENVDVYTIPLLMGVPGKDGIQKTMAKSMCSHPFHVQFDADEVCLGDKTKWLRLMKDLDSDILNLPVLEPFGEICNLRLNKEHNPVKWRIFKSNEEIVHGIPAHDRIEKDGATFSKGGSDGCFPISIVDGRDWKSNFDKNARKSKMFYEDVEKYKEHVEQLLENDEPAVLHLGHVDLFKKIQLFLNEWRFWWAELYDKDPEDLSIYWPEGNPPFSIKTSGIDRFNKISMKDEVIFKKCEELVSTTPVVKIEALSKYGDLTNAPEGISV